MFRNIFIFALFATAAGYCFASENPPQVVTSQVFYNNQNASYESSNGTLENNYAQNQSEQTTVQIPTWPIAGSDADAEIACKKGSADCNKSDNIKIVSKIGADLIVENNFNLGARGASEEWSGGANMLHGGQNGMQIPSGFESCEDAPEMPLMRREMLEDDGGNVLSVSKNSRKKCNSGINLAAATADTLVSNEIPVNLSADAESPKDLQDQVRSWVVASGQSLREVLQNWADKEGWDLVWATPREYPIGASAVFKGRFVDVSSALVRNFGRATPVPYAKFYKGNRVLVVSTTEE